ncbi:MAG: hypothetical protein JSU73_11830 [candidate division WOR-3 bacterium]|nr:MAG: hypothetical protein JSU73_11830 [candidate division WOR-3 bacterium]
MQQEDQMGICSSVLPALCLAVASGSAPLAPLKPPGPDASLDELTAVCFTIRDGLLERGDTSIQARELLARTQNGIDLLRRATRRDDRRYCLLDAGFLLVGGAVTAALGVLIAEPVQGEGFLEAEIDFGRFWTGCCIGGLLGGGAGYLAARGVTGRFGASPDPALLHRDVTGLVSEYNRLWSSSGDAVDDY